MINRFKILVAVVILLPAAIGSCNGAVQPIQQSSAPYNTENTTADEATGNTQQPLEYSPPAAVPIERLSAAGDYDAAVAAAQSALKENPSDDSLKQKLADAYIDRSWYYKSKRLPPYALDDLKKAIEAAPDYYKAYYERGCFHNNQWQYPLGIYYLDKSIALKNDFAPAWSERSFSNYKRKEYDQAMADVNHAIELQSDQAPFYYNRSLIYRALGNNEEAAKDLQTTLKYSNDSALIAKAEKDMQTLQAPPAK